ncbi:MAG TPA: hypothetical protein VKX34_03865 [Aequorivita sp.]|nr:hypothetical protein [Aequorivita sp.]
MKKSFLLILMLISISVFSCKKDEERSCMTCSSIETGPFEICHETDGTASINGQNTGTPYDEYLSGLQESGADCN